jgi:hypothetical protein
VELPCALATEQILMKSGTEGKSTLKVVRGTSFVSAQYNPLPYIKFRLNFISFLKNGSLYKKKNCYMT